MPENTRVHRCVQDVKAKQGGSDKSPANAYAVCQASTGQNFHTGRVLAHADCASSAIKLAEAQASLSKYASDHMVEPAEDEVLLHTAPWSKRTAALNMAGYGARAVGGAVHGIGRAVSAVGRGIQGIGSEPGKPIKRKPGLRGAISAATSKVTRGIQHKLAGPLAPLHPAAYVVGGALRGLGAMTRGAGNVSTEVGKGLNTVALIHHSEKANDFADRNVSRHLNRAADLVRGLATGSLKSAAFHKAVSKIPPAYHARIADIFDIDEPKWRRGPNGVLTSDLGPTLHSHAMKVRQGLMRGEGLPDHLNFAEKANDPPRADQHDPMGSAVEIAKAQHEVEDVQAKRVKDRELDLFADDKPRRKFRIKKTDVRAKEHNL